jgi:chemotaxis protein CheD
MRNEKNTAPAIIVGPGECQFASEQRLVTFQLQSCIVLAIHVPGLKLAAMLRFALPDSAMDPAVAKREPWLFADTGIPLILQRLRELGATNRQISIRAVGAANVPGSGPLASVAKQNEVAMRRILWKEGILLDGEDIGGSLPRSVWLETRTGMLLVRTGHEFPNAVEQFPGQSAAKARSQAGKISSR